MIHIQKNTLLDNILNHIHKHNNNQYLICCQTQLHCHVNNFSSSCCLRCTMIHAVPARSHEVTVACNYVSKCTAEPRHDLTIGNMFFCDSVKMRAEKVGQTYSFDSVLHNKFLCSKHFLEADFTQGHSIHVNHVSLANMVNTNTPPLTSLHLKVNT
jgi:hypothetical protein